jgi:hypothetical protein
MLPNLPGDDGQHGELAQSERGGELGRDGPAHGATAAAL